MILNNYLAMMQLENWRDRELDVQVSSHLATNKEKGVEARL